MKNLKLLGIKPKVDAAICTFLFPFKPGDQLTTDDCIKYVHKMVTKYIRADTITRYMRFLRYNEKINYTHVGEKKDRIIQILEPGTPHSL